MSTAILRVITISTLLLLHLHADKIFLKNGEILEGKIIEEKGDEVVIQIQVTKSIREPRTFKRADILKIEAEAKDKIPFEKLSTLTPTQDLLDAGEYHLRIAQAQKFIADFPASENLDAAKKILTTLQEELTRVETGDLKFDKKWISADEKTKNAYDFDALLVLQKMKSALAKNNLQEALTHYDDLVKSNPRSSYQSQADTLAKQILSVLKAAALKLQKNSPSLMENRRMSIEKADSSRARALTQEFERQTALYNKIIEKARAENKKWFPISPHHPQEIEILLQNIDTAERKLAEPPRDTTNLGLTYREGLAALDNEDLDSAKKSLDVLQTADIAQKYTSPFKSRIQQLEKKQQEEKEARLTAENEERKAQELAAQQAAEAEQKAKEEERKKIEMERRLAEQKAEEEATAAEETEEEKGGIMKFILIGVIIIAILAIVVALAFGKKKEDE